MQQFYANGLAMPSKMNWKEERSLIASDPTTTQAQPKNELRITQQRPSLNTGYRQGSPKDDTTNTQETANNDTGNVRLMYRECTVSVRGVYRKGTKEVLERYWRATKDILNACTSGVDQRYSKSRRVVGAMTNISMPFVLALICFMLFNLSAAWAQSAESRTAEGQIPESTTTGHYAQPYHNATVIETTRKNLDADLDRFPMMVYNVDESLIKPLQIGDSIPDEIWDMPLKIVNDEKGIDTIFLKDFKERNLIVLDFWAQWCKPCIQSMQKWEDYLPHLDDQLFFLGVFIDYDYKALPYIKKRNWTSSTAIGLNAHVLNRYFFSEYMVSKIVWIKDGVLENITGLAGYDIKNIQQLMKGKHAAIAPDLYGTYTEEGGNNDE